MDQALLLRAIPYLSKDPDDQWGNWIFSRGHHALYLMRGGRVAYEVPVAQIAEDSNALLGWIGHIADKVGSEDLGDFVRALGSIRGFPHVECAG